MNLQNRSSSLELLKNKLVSQAIEDRLFKVALSEAVADITKQSRRAPNEATIEGAFERIIYALLNQIGVKFHPEKESSISTCRHTQKGRMDSRLGAVVIEYKHHSELRSTQNKHKASAQLENYITALSLKLNNEVVGILTDGQKLQEIRALNGEVISESSFEELTYSILHRFIKIVISLESKALSPQNLIRDFCGDSYDGIIFKVARELNNILTKKATQKTQMLRSEWEALFRLSHDDKSQQKRIEDRRRVLGEIFGVDIVDTAMEYQSLFALHTAYAIILKFIAYRVVSDVRFGTVLQDFKSLATANSGYLREVCASLEEGDLFRNIGVLNLLEGDFFSWYPDKDQWNSIIASSVKNIVSVLARYEDVKTVFEKSHAVELFRSLYERTVPQVIRASFGEFYTPYWLAQSVIDSSRPTGNWSVLDPCCGSGTFLIAAISLMRKELLAVSGTKKEGKAKAILDRVFGIDLNPLAVLTARIHFFIHIADLIEENEEEIVIPVFLGDASNVPTICEKEDSKFFYYELKTLKTPVTVHMPIRMAKNYKHLISIMSKAEVLVKESRYEGAKEYLIDNAGVEPLTDIEKRYIEDLVEQLAKLEKNHWNGIWARIVGNFIATACIGPFTNIVGNPPWIDWKSLPAGYREKVKGLCIDRGLFSGAGRTGGINLNICALITHVSASNWLSEEGHLAFLMPKELISQASYEGWRRTVGGDSLSLVELRDWSEAGHPFDPVKEDFMTYVFQASKRSQSKVPLLSYKLKNRRDKPSEWSEITEAHDRLSEVQLIAGQIINDSSSYTIAVDSEELNNFKHIAGNCSYIGREGVEFYPQELLLFEYLKPGPKEGTAWVQNIQVQKSKYKIARHKVLLETKYLFPLVKGPYIKKFKYDDPGILVSFPYEMYDPQSPIPSDRLKKESPLLFAYYKKFKEQLENQTAYSDSIRGSGEFYGLARTGPYSFRSTYVAFRDNTKWQATVVRNSELPWGEKKRYLFQNHAVSICEREDGDYITIDEAYFISAIFNTNIVENFIYASSDNRSFKIRPPVYVPLYDKDNERHRKIVKLSKQLHKGTDKSERVLREVEREYLCLAKRRNF